MVKRSICILAVFIALCFFPTRGIAADTSSRFEKAGDDANEPMTKDSNIVELAYDDGKKADMLSISGSGHCVKFTAPKDANVLTAVKIYGSRYGEAEPPAEDFYVWLCDLNFEVIKEFTFPYSHFKMRGLAKWVTLNIEPTVVKPNFIICVGFDPSKTKGIYVYYDGQSGGRSFTGLPGGKLEPFNKGDWMIRAVISKGEQTVSKEEKPADKKPPVVVGTSPQAFASDVEPSLGVIKVTFDQPMMDKSWSWTGGGETYPKLSGQPSYNESKTICSLPVQLEPGKVYWVGINSPSFRNFKSEGGVCAKPYVILFATKDSFGNPTPIPDDLLLRAKAINGE